MGGNRSKCRPTCHYLIRTDDLNIGDRPSPDRRIGTFTYM